MKARLGKEYKNTCLVQFKGNINFEKLIDVLKMLHILNEKRANWYENIPEGYFNEDILSELIKDANKMAPTGCKFTIKACNENIIDVGYYSV